MVRLGWSIATPNRTQRNMEAALLTQSEAEEDDYQ
jgi:hypothetical protein